MAEAPIAAPVAAPAASTPPPVAATPPPAAAAPPPAASTTTWDSGFNDDLKGYVQNKGFKGPQDVLDSYRNMEKLIGVPQERVLKLPESMESPEARAIWEKLGAPKDAKEYGFQPPTGADPKLTEWAASTFHEIGVPKDMATKILTKFNEMQAGNTTAAKEAMKAQYQAQDAKLRTEWGLAYDQNKNIAAAAMRNLGLTEDQVNTLGATLGVDGATKLLHKFGAATGEATFVGGSNNSGSAMTPEQAQHQIKQMISDREFGKKLQSGDIEAKRRWESAHKFAYQGDQII